MINEDATFRWKGYYSKDLSRGSGKRVWANCDSCGRGRWVEFRYYNDLCHSCSLRTKEYRMKRSALSKGENNGWYGKRHSDETIEKQRKSAKGKHSGKNNPNYGKSPSDETRMKTSATLQGISMEEWDGFARAGKYCHLWNEKLRESIREEFGRKCFICGKNEEQNGMKLDVHHTNYGKMCMCSYDCRLVPLCKSCHTKTNHNKFYWYSYIMCKLLLESSAIYMSYNVYI